MSADEQGINGRKIFQGKIDLLCKTFVKAGIKDPPYKGTLKQLY